MPILFATSVMDRPESRTRLTAWSLYSWVKFRRVATRCPPLRSAAVYDRLSTRSGTVHLDQPPQSPQGWERWFQWVTKKAIEVDYLIHDGTPSAPRDRRTHLVHAACVRTRSPTRTAGSTVEQQRTTRA